jgi:hypothetical protein
MEELERKRQREEEEEQLLNQKDAGGDGGGEGDSETDDSDDDDYGPTPAAGIWAGGNKLQEESERLADEPNDVNGDDETKEQPSKKLKAS